MSDLRLQPSNVTERSDDFTWSDLSQTDHVCLCVLYQFCKINTYNFSFIKAIQRF